MVRFRDLRYDYPDQIAPWRSGGERESSIGNLNVVRETFGSRSR